MYKTTLAVMLLSAAQSAYALEMRSRRGGMLSREELNELVEEELATGDYVIGRGVCSQRRIENSLKQYFKKEHNCNRNFGVEGRRPNETKLDKCLVQNERRKE